MKEIKDKTIVLCLPGREYSGTFLCSFTELVISLRELGARVRISQKYSSMVNAARCMVAGADLMNGKYQKPFNGIDYDYTSWSMAAKTGISCDYQNGDKYKMYENTEYFNSLVGNYLKESMKC